MTCLWLSDPFVGWALLAWASSRVSAAPLNPAPVGSPWRPRPAWPLLVDRAARPTHGNLWLDVLSILLLKSPVSSLRLTSQTSQQKPGVTPLSTPHSARGRCRACRSGSCQPSSCLPPHPGHAMLLPFSLLPRVKLTPQLGGSVALSYAPPAVPHSFSELGLQMWLASLSPLRCQAPFLLWDFVPAASHPGRPFPSLLLIHI